MRPLRLIAGVLGLALAVLSHRPAAAQDAATLVADSLRIEADSTLIAEGNVEVFFKGTRLVAQSIRFDRISDELIIEGPLRLTDATGETVILADSAALGRDLTGGILTGARLVLDRQLQLAATEIARVSGRYTRLENAVASSCEVCAGNPVPLWEIRARRIIHDQQERQLYFDRAQMRVAGVPVFYLPRLRMPDPTLKRADGLLLPSIRTTSALGFGVKVPYFLTFGPSRDLTITPYIAPGRTTAVELRYRQAFSNGVLNINGTLARDDLYPDTYRHYIFGTARFVLPQNFILDLGIEKVSDEAFLLDYGYSDKDRLTNSVNLTRTRRNEHASARLAGFTSIREGDVNVIQPNKVADLTFHRRFRPKIIGGEGGLRFQLHNHTRKSDADGLGRDVSRVSLRLDWRRNWVTPQGIVLAALTDINGDLYSVRQDSAFADTVGRVHPTVGAELRWPFVKVTPAGVSHVIEPIAQVVLSPRNPEPVPNEDSTFVEFDEGNLFSISRFPGNDAVETGLRANLGLGWSRRSPDGWTLGVLAGRVYQADPAHDAGTGLSGEWSDWLAVVELRNAGGWSLTNRALIDNDLSVTKNELRALWLHPKGSLSTTYLYQTAAPDQGRPEDTSELTLGLDWALSDNWQGAFDTRYDVTADRTARAGIGLQYSNECVTVDFSVSRRFTSSTSVRPTTDFGLSVELTGLGDRGRGRVVRRACMR